jgi:predicted neuraminidase
LYKIQRREFIEKKIGTDFLHATSLLRYAKDQILLTWFGGSKEGNDDVKIYLSSYENNHWSEPYVLEDGKDTTHWNPVLFSPSEKNILLFYKVGSKICSWKTYVCESIDGGKTFSKSNLLITDDRGGRGPVRNKPIKLLNGDILAPASKEDGEWFSFVDISTDNGITWKMSNEIHLEGLEYSKEEIQVTNQQKKIPVSNQSFYGRGVIQPTLWESEYGFVHMLLRSTEERIYRSDSTDFGRTWSPAYRTELPNNNSGIDLVKIEDGRLILAYNPVGKNWGSRSPLSLAVSCNNGATWEKFIDLDSGNGEFSYPAIIAEKNTIYVTYTHERSRIAFWKILMEEVNE